MARMKDLLMDLENYEQLTYEQQKEIREMYNIRKSDVAKLLNLKEEEITIKE